MATIKAAYGILTNRKRVSRPDFWPLIRRSQVRSMTGTWEIEIGLPLREAILHPINFPPEWRLGVGVSKYAGCIGMKVKTNVWRTSSPVLFCILVSAIFTPPEYVVCQSLFPDENPDHSGSFRISQIPSTSLRVSNFVRPSALKYSSGSLLSPEVPFSQSINARLALPVILRC